MRVRRFGFALGTVCPKGPSVSSLDYSAHLEAPFTGPPASCPVSAATVGSLFPT